MSVTFEFVYDTAYVWILLSKIHALLNNRRLYSNCVLISLYRWWIVCFLQYCWSNNIDIQWISSLLIRFHFFKYRLLWKEKTILDP